MEKAKRLMRFLVKMISEDLVGETVRFLEEIF